MKKYGLIGEKLTHSYSKTLHGLLADYDYQLLPMPPEALDSFFKAGDFAGLNVTIPYKQSVIPYCSELSAVARHIGSVNTVVRRPDGSLYGDNTDAYGFLTLAQSVGMEFKGQKTLVLGSGGTSLTACAVIRAEGGQPVVISRKGENSYETLERHQDAAYLVNTTPVGMYPTLDAAPVDLQRLPSLKGVLDVIYNPLRTRLIQQAQAMGIPASGGLTMLVYQAVRACELFSGKAVTPDKAAMAEGELRRASLNLVLVGMPGCGKTTVGRALGQLLQMPVVDLDSEIEQEAGITIPMIFEREGEAGFRRREAAMVARYGKESGRILVTGGGAVKNPLNREALRANGFVVHLTRSLDALPLQGRPLSKNHEALEALWQERAPLYAQCCDVERPNDKTPAQCAGRIREAMNEALCAQRA
ncbi:MAG: shikimate kinase [Eubacteriales bacterium]|nr:shikimate kinase [Eubacteriales bacterium]